jgi:radical SAM protein with 4Fe4S-binding SPASM domain
MSDSGRTKVAVSVVLAMPHDPLNPAERAQLMAAARPRSLPLAPRAEPARRHLPLSGSVRAADAVRPIYAVWEITLACDLACRHCGSRAGRARPDELSTAECIDLVHQMSALGVREITLIGGEAYLRPDWLTIVREIRAQGITPTMTSGGRGIDARLAAEAADAGLAGVSISLDGLAETHDRLRGVKGSHAHALAALDHLRAAGIPVTVNTQINRLSMPELPELLDVLAAHGAHSWQIQLTVPMGRAADEPEVLLQPYDLLELFPGLQLLAERCKALGVRLLPGNNIGYFGPHEATLRGYMLNKHASSCMAGQLTLGIEADGTIKGCPSLPTAAWGGGNIRDASLLEIWERASPLRYTRDRTVDDLWGYCHDCYYADTCRAGCTWTSDVFFGRPGNNPYCHHRALEFAKQGKRERLVRVTSAPGQPFDHGRFELLVEPSTPL